MERLIGALLASLSVVPLSHVAAQTPAGTAAPAAVATVAARPTDVSSIDAIINALYDANSILVDQKRDADRFRSLFVPGARLMPTGGRGNGPRVIRIQTVEEYVHGAASGQPHGRPCRRDPAA